jgi:RND family efflux transporter MFP subunit
MNRVHAVNVCALSVALLSGCKNNQAGATAGGKRGMKQAAFPVEVQRVDLRPQDVVVSAPGVVDAFEHVQVTARVSGVIDKITFVEGQEIKRGHVLANIDSRRYALNVSSAKAALQKSEATAADNEQALKRRQNASETNPGLIPGEEIETYQTKLRTAQADVAQSAEALKLAQLNLDDSNVKAPTEGVIQTRNVETGQYVQAGTIIATLLQREPMLLHFSVSTAEAPRLKVGMPAEFTLKESQQTYNANITLVAGSADAESRLVPVTAQVDADKKFWLRPGSFAQVQVKLAPQKQFPMIPQAAARPSDRGFLAYVVQGDTAHERVLQLGMHTSDGWVEVKDGLQVGDMLVTKGVEALAEGTKVQTGSAAPGSSAHPAASGDAPAASGSGEGKHKRATAGAASSSAATEAP